MTNKTTEENPLFRHRAEQRGYAVKLLDEMGDPAAESGRPVAGAVLNNPDGDVVWVPAEDLAVVGDLLIRAHVQVGRRAVG